jgi:hypothetical protein
MILLYRHWDESVERSSSCVPHKIEKSAARSALANVPLWLFIKILLAALRTEVVRFSLIF